MQPNCFIATLSASLAANGSETEVFLSNITTLTGETVTTAQFSTMGRGVLTIDPLSSVNIEFVGFTGVDATGIGFTGLTRGLSALSNSTITANKKYHPAGTQVILAWGVHNLLDLQTYITNAVSGSLGTATDVTAGSTKLTVNMGSNARARSALVTQNSTPNMTVYVQPFSFVNGSTTITFAGGNTGTMTAPVSNPRYDLVVYRPASTALALVTGAEGSSPSLPTATSGDIVLASLYHRVGETTIIDRNISPNTEGYIASWYEPTIYNNMTALNSTQVTQGTDQFQTTSNGTQAVGKSNTTGNPSIIAEKFIPTVSGISGVILWKIADTGTFTGSVKIAIQADSSGSPSGTDLASYTISNTAWIKLAAAATFSVSFSSEYESMVVGNSYWIVVSPSTSDSSNHPNLGLNTAGGYTPGILKYNNSSDGWVLVATSILYFQTLSGVVSKIVQTDSTGLIPLNISREGLASFSSSQTTGSGTIGTFQIPGGFFGLNTGIKMKIYLNQGGATGNLAVLWNGTALFTISSLATQNSVTILDVIIINQNSLSAQNYFYQYISTAAAAATFANSNGGTSTVDFSQPGIFTVTSNGSINLNGALLEKIA